MLGEMSYNDFAYVYDLLTDDVEYEKRSDYIHSLIGKHFPGKAELLCDLGCGTGTICRFMTERGYDCIGIDGSDTMLSVAMQKNTDKDILFLNQDICNFELYGTVDVFISTLDTVNYITESDGVNDMFALIQNYLNPDGLFIFDVNTKHKFENILGNNTFVFEKGNVFYTWENCYEDECLDFYLEFFVRDNSNKYTRFSEHHFQKYHSDDFLVQCAEKHSLTLEAVYGDLTMDNPHSTEERIFYVFRK